MTAPINRTMAPADWALLVVLSLFWGGSYFFVAVAITALPPLTVVAVRVASGASLLYIAMRVTGARLPTDAATWFAFAVMGFAGNALPFSLIAWGQSTIPSGLASILVATTPVFTVFVAHMRTDDEPMTPASLTGIALGLTGVVVLVGADVLAEAGGHLLAELAVLLAALSYALSTVYARRFTRHGLAPMTAATGQVTAAAFLITPVALVVDRPWTLAPPGIEIWGSILGLGALSTALAYIIFYRVLARAGSVNLMLVTFLVPVSAILLGFFILGERLSANHFLGMAAIGAGLAVIDGRPLRWLTRRTA